MEMKKIVAAALIGLGALGFAGTADAATGVVDLGAVLKDNAAYQKAVKSVQAEQQKLQRQYDKEAPSLSKEDQAALQKRLSEQLTKKDQEMGKPIIDDLNAAIEKTAKAKRLDTVARAGGLVYASAEVVDITEDVKANMTVK